MSTILRAPFPWFGGKSRASALVWEGLGPVTNYVEPFAGSLAILLSRPDEPRTETVNDLDCYVANFWRALRADPDAVADHADWPINEADLHARHRWLVEQGDFRESMRADPEFFDVRVAGWWVWGLSMWIGGGWCSVRDSEHQKRPNLATKGKGVHRVHQRIPELGASGSGHAVQHGVHSARLKWQRGDAGHIEPSESARIPQLNQQANGRGIRKAPGGALVVDFLALADRLRDVRVACGDWARILTPAVTHGHGITGVVLDPPYSTKERAAGIYAHDGPDVAEAVREWAVANGDNPLLRIVLCGYEGEHAMPKTWRIREWKAAGGFGSQRKDGSNVNAARERLWFSPACLVAQRGLFEAGASS